MSTAPFGLLCMQTSVLQLVILSKHYFGCVF